MGYYNNYNMRSNFGKTTWQTVLLAVALEHDDGPWIGREAASRQNTRH